MRIGFIQIFIITLLFISSTVSAQWEKTNSSISGDITSMTTNGNNIFAGTNHGLIYSSDGGKKWDKIIINRNEQSDRYIQSIVTSKNKMFLLSNGLYSSSDGGFNWVKSIDFNEQALTLAASGTNVIVGLYFGVSISTDEGQSWVYKDIPVVGGNGLRIRALAINGNQIYVGYNFGGLFYSRDLGSSWKSIADTISSETSILSLFIDDNNVYVGTSGWNLSIFNLYKSTNQGSSWTQIDNGLKNSRVISFGILGDKLFVGTNGTGIYFTKDDGLTWQESNKGLGYISVSSIIFRGKDIYAGSATGQGIFCLKDSSSKWESLFNELTDINMKSFAKIGSFIFVGTLGGGVFLYDDSSKVWKSTNNGLTNNIITSLLARDNLLYATTEWGIYNSTNFGVTWNPISSDLSRIYFESLEVDGKNMYAGSFYNGIYASTNSGITWTNTISNLCTVNSITIKSNYIFAMTPCSILRSSDKGLTWLNIFPNGGNLLKVVGNRIYATLLNGLYYSDDDGDNWQSITAFPMGTYSDTFLAIETFNNAIFISTKYGGIFYSIDNGLSWKNINDNLAAGYPNAYTNVNCLSVFNNCLFIGTLEQGVWCRNINTIKNINDTVSVKMPQSFLLKQNYPNPFNPSTTISYEIPKNSFVTLEVCDILGRKVATLVQEQKASGIYNVAFNANEHSSGIYFYTLRTKVFIQTKKMILIR